MYSLQLNIVNQQVVVTQYFIKENRIMLERIIAKVYKKKRKAIKVVKIEKGIYNKVIIKIIEKNGYKKLIQFKRRKLWIQIKIEIIK